MAKILVVDDEKHIRGSLKEILEYEKKQFDCQLQCASDSI